MAEPGKIFKHSPTDLILKAAAALAFDESGEAFAPQPAGIKRIWRVFSRQGGAGVTTVSLCLARMMAAEGGEKVLYMNTDAADDYGRWVRTAREQNLLPKRQLCYAAEKSLGVDLGRWLDTDEYGVMLFKAEQGKMNPFFSEAEESNLLRCINKSGLISTVVIDEGKQVGSMEKETMPRIKEMLIGIERYGDVRRGSMVTDISVMNFSDKEGVNGEVVNIPEDRESFKETDGSISVDLSGLLGEGIKNLLKEILATERV